MISPFHSDKQLRATLQSLKGKQADLKSDVDLIEASLVTTERSAILELLALRLFTDCYSCTLRELKGASVRLLIICGVSLGTGFVISPIFLFFPVLHYFLERRSLRRKCAKRAENFELDYTAFLITLSSSIKAGRDPLSALLESERMFSRESEIHQQIVKMRQAMDQMSSEESAIFEFARAIDNPDISLFRIAFLLARKEGSALSLCLERLARVTRQRQSFRRKVRGAIALQRVSSYGIAAIALLTLGFQLLTNLDNFKLALNHPVGMIGLIAAATLISVGLLWMSKIAPARF